MIPLLYIAAPSFSGSTLLTFLLNAHPDVATMGELKWGDIDLETYQCSCGDLLTRCPFWNTVAVEMAERGVPFELARPATGFRCRAHAITDRVARARIRGAAFEWTRRSILAALPAARRAWSVVTAVNRAVIEIILERQGASVFLDASKDPVRAWHLLRTGAYSIYIIHLIRDGRGVVNSAIKNTAAPARLASLEWLQTHQQVRRLESRLPEGRVLRVRYEDLVTDTRGVIEKLHRFVGLREVPWRDDYCATEHHILGNRMRLHATSEIKLDERWRTMLNGESLRIFERLAGTLNGSYGYH